MTPDICPHCGQPWAGKHIYTRTEIEKICGDLSEYEKHRDAIDEAAKEGRIDYNR
ncbi:MAG: hypothetical protein A4E44_00153 [Methanosaeta sp. PtaB.Bin018]|nr:MAG: hypothetical protein A4E44_00153 [Methanosaeta sp. PtaB.Bin018]OPY48115.1 MAG: hypothetical protein A4E46_00090 [Methanosaeta sp. PtaU1.Bin016]